MPFRWNIPTYFARINPSLFQRLLRKQVGRRLPRGKLSWEQLSREDQRAVEKLLKRISFFRSRLGRLDLHRLADSLVHPEKHDRLERLKNMTTFDLAIALYLEDPMTTNQILQSTPAESMTEYAEFVGKHPVPRIHPTPEDCDSIRREFAQYMRETHYSPQTHVEFFGTESTISIKFYYQTENFSALEFGADGIPVEVIRRDVVPYSLDYDLSTGVLSIDAKKPDVRETIKTLFSRFVVQEDDFFSIPTDFLFSAEILTAKNFNFPSRPEVGIARVEIAHLAVHPRTPGIDLASLTVLPAKSPPELRDALLTTRMKLDSLNLAQITFCFHFNGRGTKVRTVLIRPPNFTNLTGKRLDRDIRNYLTQVFRGAQDQPLGISAAVSAPWQRSSGQSK